MGLVFAAEAALGVIAREAPNTAGWTNWVLPICLIVAAFKFTARYCEHVRQNRLAPGAGTRRRDTRRRCSDRCTVSDENGRAADEAAVGEVLIAVDGLELPVRRNHSLKLNGELLLAVDRGNSARRFYERLGFRQL